MGLLLHAREDLWAIPAQARYQKNRKVDRVQYNYTIPEKEIG
jgi:hypothetical protein